MQEIAACSHEKTAALFKAAVLRDPAGYATLASIVFCFY